MFERTEIPKKNVTENGNQRVNMPTATKNFLIFLSCLLKNPTLKIYLEGKYRNDLNWIFLVVLAHIPRHTTPHLPIPYHGERFHSVPFRSFISHHHFTYRCASVCAVHLSCIRYSGNLYGFVVRAFSYSTAQQPFCSFVWERAWTRMRVLPSTPHPILWHFRMIIFTFFLSLSHSLLCSSILVVSLSSFAPPCYGRLPGTHQPSIQR